MRNICTVSTVLSHFNSSQYIRGGSEFFSNFREVFENSVDFWEGEGTFLNFRKMKNEIGFSNFDPSLKCAGLRVWTFNKNIKKKRRKSFLPCVCTDSIRCFAPIIINDAVYGTLQNHVVLLLNWKRGVRINHKTVQICEKKNFSLIRDPRAKKKAKRGKFPKIGRLPHF